MCAQVCSTRRTPQAAASAEAEVCVWGSLVQRAPQDRRLVLPRNYPSRTRAGGYQHTSLHQDPLVSDHRPLLAVADGRQQQYQVTRRPGYLRSRPYHRPDGLKTRMLVRAAMEGSNATTTTDSLCSSNISYNTSRIGANDGRSEACARPWQVSVMKLGVNRQRQHCSPDSVKYNTAMLLWEAIHTTASVSTNTLERFVKISILWRPCLLH